MSKIHVNMSGKSLGRKTIWLDKLTCFEKNSSFNHLGSTKQDPTRVGLRLVHSILGRQQRHLNGDLSIIVKGALTSASRGNKLFLTTKKRLDKAETRKTEAGFKEFFFIVVLTTGFCLKGL